MTQTSTVQCVFDTVKTDSCPFTAQQTVDANEETLIAKRKERVIGSKPNFENGYITMNEDGLAIAMIPKQAEQ